MVWRRSVCGLREEREGGEEVSPMIGLDFETYGGVSLPDHGLARYAGDETFRPLLGAIAWRADVQVRTQRFDFVSDYRASISDVRDAINGKKIVAHNAGFEQAVLDTIGLSLPSSRFIDSAVVARGAGGGGHLEAAAPQLLDTGKLDMGKALIRLFSIPGSYQEENENLMFDPRIVADHPQEWEDFGNYCEVDASLGLQIAEYYLSWLTSQEMEYQAVTQEMNNLGWAVDVHCVEEMQRRYLENLDAGLERFRFKYNAQDLNLNSLKQMKEWCAARGMKLTSFDEKHVAQYLRAIEKKLHQPMLDLVKAQGYEEIEALLETKQLLGGSSLKKLATILDTVSQDITGREEPRLKDQYLHIGASQTWRTTGRSVQMQNLKQLTTVAPMEELDDPGIHWDNDVLAENIRQVFTATHEAGRLIVGDFKSVESVGLAYLADEKWKLEAYRIGDDVYKRLATKMFSLPYDQITDALRKPGKVGELSCGYGAGAGAVKDFAAKMNIEMSEAEATKVVWDWRDACPSTVDFWTRLNEMLLDVVRDGGTPSMALPDGLVLKMKRITTPTSLDRQHPGVQSIQMYIVNGSGHFILKRYFHGCYETGRNIRYYKPSDRKTGDLWKNTFTNPKTKQIQFYELYGGKLAGILTQSFCREIFMESLLRVRNWTWASGAQQVRLVGQFHDEIVVDFQPGVMSLSLARSSLSNLMSHCSFAPSFPLRADIKDDYRYTK
jgi:DNA polymerase